MAAALLLPGCPLKDGYYLETDDPGSAASSGGTNASGGGTVSSSGRGGVLDSGGESSVGGAPSAGGLPGAGSQAGTGGDPESGTAGCVSATSRGHEYAFCFGASTQSSARADCGTRGMTLAVIDDEAENDWIAQTLVSLYRGDAVRAFIGANDSTTEGEWRWADGVSFWSGDANGEPLNGRYTNWSDGEPNNESPIAGAADCLTMYLSDGRWGDLSCDAELPYVCESR
ncbi:MAG TPA: C-type lectin domain-containing protein [Polyangiaceae bacterium]|nr:C-type lectin domain-containing protein [Polyangiaceae bacterium]